jgi:ABC-type multidrug transport system fused ATPase/permease subunit
MQDDINTLHSLTAHFYTTTGRAVGAIAISVIYLFAMDWRLAIVSLLPFPGFFLFFGRAMKASGTNMEQFVAGMGRINNAVVEFVNGIPVVKAFGATGRSHGSYRAAVDAFADAFAAFTRPLVGSMANANALIAPVAVLGVVVLAGTAFVAVGTMAPWRSCRSRWWRPACPRPCCCCITSRMTSTTPPAPPSACKPCSIRPCWRSRRRSSSNCPTAPRSAWKASLTPTTGSTRSCRTST